MADLEIAAGGDMKCPEPLTDKTDKSKVLSVLSVPTRGGFLLRRAACPKFWEGHAAQSTRSGNDESSEVV
jgi:hypothetical protein